MDLHLKGKNAVILGGTRGIGRAIADTLADEGANVAICARNADQVAETVRALEGRGVKAWGEVVDIADAASLVERGWVRHGWVGYLDDRLAPILARRHRHPSPSSPR